MKAKINLEIEVLKTGHFQLSDGEHDPEVYNFITSLIAACLRKIGDKCYMLEREGFRRQGGG